MPASKQVANMTLLSWRKAHGRPSQRVESPQSRILLTDVKRLSNCFSLSGAIRLEQLVTIVLIALICAGVSPAQNDKPPGDSETISGHVSTLGLDALPWHSNIHIYIQDDSARRPDAPPVIIAEKTIVTEGEQIPLPFSISIPSSKIESKHQYSICAGISITAKPMFTCDKPVLLHLQKSPKPVQIMVRRLP